MVASQISCRNDLVLIPTAGSPADRSIDQRRLRRLAILNVLRRDGPLARVEIAKVTGFNLRSTSMLVDELVRQRVVLEQPAVEIPRGRRPTPVVLNHEAAVILGIDIGRHRTIGRLMDLGGGLVHEEELISPAFARGSMFAEWSAKVARRTIQCAPAPLPPLCGIGVGLPAIIHSGGRNKLFDYPGAAARIRKALQADYPVEVFVDRDARMMALGSTWFGVGRKYSNFAVLKIGVNLGLGVVIDGRLVQGSFHKDLEFGHLPMGEHGVPCYCGGAGCLENLASGGGLERLAEKHGLATTDPGEVAELARSGDRKALAVFEEFSAGLGRAIATVINLFSPEAVVLSGRVSRAADIFLPRAREIANQHTVLPLFKNTAMIVSDPNARLGALGAVSIVYSHIFHSGHVNVHEVI